MSWVMMTAVVLQEKVSISLGAFTVGMENPSLLWITERALTRISERQVRVVSGSWFSHQSAATASLKTEPGAAYSCSPIGGSSAPPVEAYATSAPVATS